MNQKNCHLPRLVTHEVDWHQSLSECPWAQADVKSDFKNLPN